MPELVDLDRAECERLLRRGTFGRVVLVTPSGPDIVPVNYTVVDDTVVVRTTSSGMLARHGHGRRLAFEVDLVDHDRWHGWSVVAQGVGELVVNPEDGAPGRVLLRPWADGDRSSELRIAWTELTGRRVGTAWDAESGLYSRRTAR
jgi:nitroimidazol reductase NimA-like FMN-containing flavoprotein (pyridoxamine 5'-phosphate oxidase superfamily)